ncbi:MAG: hypothetical protein FJ276_06950 [Planctomycetes bacterium]|nr:hypothetical protein [Planctomycetota bacterium]
MALRLLVLFFAIAMRPAPGRAADEPPAINPFGRKPAVRDDAVPGYIELSDDTILTGHIHATRDTRLKIYDEELQRQREVPWDKIRQIESEVEKEWMEKEWRFRENANDQKVFTGNSYPARLHIHSITLTDGRAVRGSLSSVVYLQRTGEETRKFELHKRAKGQVGEELDALLFVRLIRLGPEALKEGEERLKQLEQQKTKRNAGKA